MNVLGIGLACLRICSSSTGCCDSIGERRLLSPMHLFLSITAVFMPALHGSFWCSCVFIPSPTDAEKAARSHFYGFLLVILGSFVFNFVLPMSGVRSFPQMASSWLSIGSIFIYLGMERFSLLAPSIKEIADDIFFRINDGVLIFDRLGVLAEMNAKAGQELGIERSAIGVRRARYLPGQLFLSGRIQRRECHFP